MVNSSGIRPVGVRILVLPDVVEEKTVGGIILAKEYTNKEKMAQIKGVLVATGDHAWEDYSTPWAKVGDRVIIGKYSGLIEMGRDEKEYRIVNDKDLVCVIEDTQ